MQSIKARMIANEATTTWLVFPETLIQDMNNQVVEARINGLNAAPQEEHSARDRTYKSFQMCLKAVLITTTTSDHSYGQKLAAR